MTREHNNNLALASEDCSGLNTAFKVGAVAILCCSVGAMGCAIGGACFGCSTQTGKILIGSGGGAMGAGAAVVAGSIGRLYCNSLPNDNDSNELNTTTPTSASMSSTPPPTYVDAIAAGQNQGKNCFCL